MKQKVKSQISSLFFFCCWNCHTAWISLPFFLPQHFNLLRLPQHFTKSLVSSVYRSTSTSCLTLAQERERERERDIRRWLKVSEKKPSSNNILQEWIWSLFVVFTPWIPLLNLHPFLNLQSYFDILQDQLTK